MKVPNETPVAQGRLRTTRRQRLPPARRYRDSQLLRAQLCLAAAGKQVPSGPDCIHEVKHDGYRMLVIRENDRVRLLSCSVDDVLPTQMTAPANRKAPSTSASPGQFDLRPKPLPGLQRPVFFDS
jgi:hypothetical protein